MAYLLVNAWEIGSWDARSGFLSVLIRLTGCFSTNSCFKVGIPYLRAKAHDYYEELGGGVDPDLDDGPQARHHQVLTEYVRPTTHWLLGPDIILDVQSTFEARL